MRKKEANNAAMGVIIMMVFAVVLTTGGCGSAGADVENERKSVRPVKAERLVLPPPERIMTFPGRAKALKEVDLSFRVGGPLTELNVDDGMKVSKGDVVARIDDRDFRVTMKTLEATLAASKAQLVEVKRQYERYQNLVKVNAASKSTYEQMKAGFEMAEARVDADTRNLEAARNALTDITLYAPFDGFVYKTFIENHETVTPGQPVISIVDLSRMEVDIDISEFLLTQTDDFISFQCTFDALPGEHFSAKIKEVGKKPNPSNSSYPLTLSLDTRQTSGILPGMASDVIAKMKSKDMGNTFVVPVSALVNKSDKETWVWILNREQGNVEKRVVTLLGLLNNGGQIEGNVSEGEWLVIAGAHHLSEGQTVRLLVKASETNIGRAL